MLEDENSVVQQNALDAIFVLAQCGEISTPQHICLTDFQLDDFVMAIYSPQTTLKIFSLLRGLDDTGPVLRVEEVITRLLAYLANGGVHFISRNICLTRVSQMTFKTYP
jgi:hypothetical protein